MREHELKTWTSQFIAIWNGTKTHELRRNDRDFKVGDMLVLQEYDSIRKLYTKRFIKAKVAFITDEHTFKGLQPGFVVMSIKVEERGTSND